MGSDVTEVGRIHEEWNKNFIEDHPLYYEKVDNAFSMKLITKASVPLYQPKDGEVIELVVIYQDTDSCKCKIEGELPILDNEMMSLFLTNLGKVYCDALNTSFDEFAKKTLNVDKHYFMIKLDATYKKYFQWGANKNYVYKDFNNKIKYKGVRLVKRGTPIIIQQFMKEFFDIVMDDITHGGVIKKVSEMMNKYEDDILAGKYIKECGEPRGVHTDSLYYDSMVISNSIFSKEFKLGNVAIFYPAEALIGHQLPKNGQVALDFGDDPGDFGVVIDYKKVLTKLKASMKKILTGLEVDATWEKIADGIESGNIDDDDLW